MVNGAKIDRIFSRANVRFGSLADNSRCPGHVRFTPKSRHWGRRLGCPLCAKSGQSTIHSMTSSEQLGMVTPSVLHLLIANSAWCILIGCVGATGRQCPLRELNLQSLGGEAGQKWAGINDLLRHPSARFGNIALDQQSRHSCSSRGCRVRLGRDLEVSLASSDRRA